MPNIVKDTNELTEKYLVNKREKNLNNIDDNHKNILSKETTAKIKGIAILIMVIHHSFGFPEYYIDGVNYPSIEILGKPSFYWISLITKICVTIFAFLTGYGYLYNKSQNLKYSIKKIIKLLERYWIILFGILIPLIYLFGQGEMLTVKQVVLNMFGINSDIELFSWYIYFYICTMIVLPFVKYLITNNKYWNFILFTFICWIGTIAGYLIAFSYNIKTNIIIDFFYYFPCVICGYFVAKYDLLERILKYSKVKRVWQAIMIIFIVIIIRSYKNNFLLLNLDIIYVPIIVAMLTFIFNRIGNIGTVFSFLGKHSVNIWFLHSIFFSPILRDATQAIAYLPHNPLLVVIWIIVLCLPFSFLVNKIIKIQGKFFQKAGKVS